MGISWRDHRSDPAAWARALGVSREACELLIDAHFVDLHCDVEVPARLFGYDPAVAHGPWRRVVPFFGHTDFPRMLEAGMTGVAYDIATNVFRPEANRQRTTLSNLRRATARIEAHPGDLAVVRSRQDYDRAVAQGRLACFLTLQGGNALAHDPAVLDGPVGVDLHRITLVHLSSSVFGGSSSPSQPDGGITDRGRAFVERCNANRILVDLAHASRKTFWGALEAHAHDLPPIVSHTAMHGVRPLWRNLDDAQARAIAERGGVVGVLYQGNFLVDVPPGFSAPRASILTHLEHLIDVAGEAAAAIGTDYDGMITPPHDLTDVTHHPLLIQDMLDRGWTEARIRRVLGLNYLAVVETIRPTTPEARTQ